MKKILIDFTCVYKEVVKTFDACNITKQVTTTKCSTEIFVTNDKDIKMVIALHLQTISDINKFHILEYSYKVLDYPIYQPKTFVDNLINEEWERIKNNENTTLILDTLYSKYVDECHKCNIVSSKMNVNKYAECMLNTIMDDEDRELFYKFIFHHH